MKVKKKRRNGLIFLCLSVGISTYADIGRNTYKVTSSLKTEAFVRLRQNTLRLAAVMNGEVNRAEAR